MPSYQVICITKPNANSSHEHITHIGFFSSPVHPTQIITVEEAIKRIDANLLEFYVSTPSVTTFIKVERPIGKKAYIRTVPDHTEKDNLLNLPHC
jgi:hypothetical protein